MSFKEWLYTELDNDGVIDPSDVDIDELDKDFLLSCTDLEEDDLDNYEEQFREHCRRRGETPVMDLD